MLTVFFLSQHSPTNQQKKILHHIHGNQLKIELVKERWEDENDFLCFVKDHQVKDVLLYIVAPATYLMLAMSAGYHFYYFWNNGSHKVYEIKLNKMETIYQLKNKSKNKRGRFNRRY